MEHQLGMVRRRIASLNMLRLQVHWTVGEQDEYDGLLVQELVLISGTN
jgi:hypothetical protein